MKNKIDIQIINAFVDNNKGGNPAGVVLNADDLSNEQKLLIAQKVGLSETAFVSESTIADFKLDFFTPTRQIAHCGHATIAAFSYLSQLGKINNKHTSKETIDGTREILIQGNLAFMEQKPPSYTDMTNYKEQILKSLGLNLEDILINAPLSIVNTGNSFLIIPVTNEDILNKLTPNFVLISEISNQFDLIGYYVFSTSSNSERDATSRMFAPSYGIEEESGTGMAAGPLACYLYDKLELRKDRFYIEQGKFMRPPSQSLITVDLTLDNNNIVKIMAGGLGVSMKSLEIEI
jgi:PhzF family phenazine biosynthesis protein